VIFQSSLMVVVSGEELRAHHFSFSTEGPRSTAFSAARRTCCPSPFSLCENYGTETLFFSPFHARQAVMLRRHLFNRLLLAVNLELEGDERGPRRTSFLTYPVTLLGPASSPPSFSF